MPRQAAWQLPQKSRAASFLDRLWVIIAACRGVAQPGSALAWGARGREFESRRPDQLFLAQRPISGLAFVFLGAFGALFWIHGQLKESQSEDYATVQFNQLSGHGVSIDLSSTVSV